LDTLYIARLGATERVDWHESKEANPWPSSMTRVIHWPPCRQNIES
jgi:hypothetical protein